MRLNFPQLLISALVLIILQGLTLVTIYNITLISMVEFNYIEFFINCPSKFMNFLNNIGKVSWIDLLYQSKFILATFLNVLFTYLFSKNIVEKHLFSKDKIRNFSFYSLGILLFIVIILSLPRFILRNFFTMFFFGEVTYISIFLSILWVLPFMSYIINIVTKYITKQTIKKEDLHFLNKNVINSINLYSICLILVILYININYTGNIILIILANIWHSLNGPVVCLPILSGDLVLVLDPNKSQMKTSDIELNGRNKKVNHWNFLDNVISPNLRDTNNWRLPVPGDKNFGKCLPIRHFDKQQLTNPVKESLTFSNSPGYFSCASIVDDRGNSGLGVRLNFKHEGLTTFDTTREWAYYWIRGKEAMKTAKEILEKNFGQILPNYDWEKLTFMAIAHPIYKDQVDILNDTKIFKLHDFDMFNLIKLKSNLPVNLAEQILANTRVIWPKNILEAWNSDLAAKINEDTSLKFFYNNQEKKLGFILEQNGEGSMTLASTPSTRRGAGLLYAESTIDANNISTGIQELNTQLDINISDLNSLRISTLVKPISSISYKASSLTKYNNIDNPVPNYTVDIHKWVSLPINSSVRLVYTSLNTALQCIVSWFGERDWFFSNNEYNDSDRLILSKNYKEDIYKSILEYPESLQGSKEVFDYPLSTFTVFRYGTNNDLFILANSKRFLHESLKSWNDEEIHIDTNIDLKFKYELWELLENLKLNSEFTRCLHNSVQIAWLDNFSMEMASIDHICNKYCGRYDNDKLDYLVTPYNRRHFKSTFNLLNDDDQQLALKCLRHIGRRS